MTIRELESVCAVDKYSNYTDAAFYENSSPSVISKHVNHVEEEFGVKLFERASRTKKMERTVAGEAIMPMLLEMLESYNSAVNAANSLSNETEELKIGYNPLIGGSKESQLVSGFLSENPNISIYRIINSRKNLLFSISNNSIDACILPLLHPMDIDPIRLFDIDLIKDVRWKQILSKTELYLGLPKTHKLASCKIITRDLFKELQNETFLFSILHAGKPGMSQHDYLREHLGIPKAKFKARQIDMSEPELAYTLIRNGQGILPRSGSAPKDLESIVFVPVEGWTYSSSLYLIYKDTKSNKALKRFIEYCENN